MDEPITKITPIEYENALYPTKKEYTFFSDLLKLSLNCLCTDKGNTADPKVYTTQTTSFTDHNAIKLEISNKIYSENPHLSFLNKN